MVKLMIMILTISMGIFVSASDLNQQVARAREEARRGMQERYQGSPIDNERAQRLTEERERVTRAVYDRFPVMQRIFNQELVRRYGLTQAAIEDLVGPDLRAYPTVDGFLIGEPSGEISRSEDSDSEQGVNRTKEQEQYERRKEFFRQRELMREAAYAGTALHASGQTLSPRLQTPTPPQRFRSVFAYPQAGSKREREESQSPYGPEKLPRLYSPRTPLSSPRTPADRIIERSPMAPSKLSISMPPLPDSSKSSE